MIFDEKIIRRGSNCYKWDVQDNDDVIPMWIADMDFKTAPPIIEALQERVAHGVFGYVKPPKEYFEAVCQWFENQHGWHIEPNQGNHLHHRRCAGDFGNHQSRYDARRKSPDDHAGL